MEKVWIAMRSMQGDGKGKKGDGGRATKEKLMIWRYRTRHNGWRMEHWREETAPFNRERRIERVWELKEEEERCEWNTSSHGELRTPGQAEQGSKSLSKDPGKGTSSTEYRRSESEGTIVLVQGQAREGTPTVPDLTY
jgi:hypothetical protein